MEERRRVGEEEEEERRRGRRGEEVDGQEGVHEPAECDWDEFLEVQRLEAV